MNMFFWRCLTLSFISAVVTGCETGPASKNAQMSIGTDPFFLLSSVGSHSTIYKYKTGIARSFVG